MKDGNDPMFVEVLHGIKEGWRKGDIRKVPKWYGEQLIENKLARRTKKRRERFGSDKGMVRRQTRTK